MNRWRVANGRYSITDGTVTLIVPYKQGRYGGVERVLKHMNSLYKTKVGGKRMCGLCERPIGRHDKWVFNADSRIEHRNCERPEEYA